MKENRFYLMPTKEVARGKQVLLVDFKDQYLAKYEGNSDLADALMIWALVDQDNKNNIEPIVLVNEDDYNEGYYGDFYHTPQTE